MKLRISLLTALSLFTVFLIPVPLVFAQVTYNVTDLGTLGGTFAQPNTLNNHGQVVGISSGPDDAFFHGFFWENGNMIDLGTLGGPVSVGNGINNSGEVVVGADTDLSGALPNTICATELICRMFIWKDGIKVPDLGTLPGGTDAGTYSFLSFGFATSLINNSHRAVGTADLPMVDPNNPPFAVFHAFLWDKGVLTDLGTLGGDNSEATAINDPGEVIGTSAISSTPDPELGFVLSHGFLWRKGQMTDLGALGGILSWANGINNQSQVVGVILTADFHIESFLWENGVMTELPPFAGDEESAASGINNGGQVVGTSGTGGPVRAVLWENGVAVDLNSRIPADSGWLLEWAGSINARRQIAGVGIHNGETRAFLLTPAAGNSNVAQSSATVAPAIGGPVGPPVSNAVRFLPGWNWSQVRGAGRRSQVRGSSVP